MSQTKSTSVVQNCETTSWCDIRRDAELALREAKTRVRQLQESIKAIDQKIQNGEPLPDYLLTKSSVPLTGNAIVRAVQ